MYLEFYKLREFPFTLSCDGKYFYESSVHTEALANMIYAVQQRKGMVLITGEVGAGKSFVGHVLRERLGPGCQSVLMQNPPESKKQLLKSFARQIGLTTRATVDKITLEEDLQDYLLRLHHRGRLVALILDEAQEMTNAALEELRLLWNWEFEGHRLIQIVLIGQPELREKIMEPRWEPLRQRIVLSYHLKNLTANDTCAYVQHRLRVASLNGSSGVFEPEAMDAIHAATDGIPRLINTLCDNALLVGYVKGQAQIGKGVIMDVLRDMTCWGLQTSGSETSTIGNG
ncbi:MAG: AAA family ATPase [Sedimentisphaerales bacterium]|nr:AAA family ATPase [Sedimentisphaerales bacterium]